MADEDNFDIDIYGDDASPEYTQDNVQDGGEVKADATTAMQTEPDSIVEDLEPLPRSNGHADTSAKHEDTQPEHSTNGSAQQHDTQQIASTGGSAHNQLQPPKQAPIQQGTKRKAENDDRPLDPGATAALLISELHWWINEDDVRGWANQSGCEDELVDVTFNEHKVNGKSKGQVFVELRSPQAATALKHTLQSFGADQHHVKKPSAVFHSAHMNPYRTLPKDVPNRKENTPNNRSGSSNFGGSQNSLPNNNNNYNQGGNSNFRGRGNFQNRNIQNNMGGGMGGGFQNRNFSSPVGGAMGYGAANPMTGFGGAAGGMGMNNFNNFNRGGAMMGGGMRGGMPPNRGNNRGGMGMMGGMPMGGMGMGMGGMGGMGMGGNMGMMGGMGGAMGGMGGNGFGAQPHFNPAFFQQQQQQGVVGGAAASGGGGGDWNPHGAKRARGE